MLLTFYINILKYRFRIFIMNKAHTSDNSETVVSLDQMFHEHTEQRRQTHQKMKWMSQSESIAWKVKIDLASQVYDILDTPSNLSNEELLTAMEEEILSGLSDSKRIKYEELHKLHQQIRIVEQQIDDLRSHYTNGWDDDEEVEYDASEEDVLFELQDQSQQRIHAIEDSSWKLQLASVFLGQKTRFQEKIMQLEDFRKNGLDAMCMPKQLQSFLKKVPYKTLPMPFGVAFLVPISYQEEKMKFLGAQYIDTPFSLVFTHRYNNHNTRDTFIHESRHNIYNGLGLGDGADVAYMVESIKTAINHMRMFDDIDAPAFLMERQYSTVVERVNDIGIHHIRENKDEILANFDRLVRWEWSTDVHKTRSGIRLLSKTIQWDEASWEDTTLLEKALMNYDFYVEEFYTRLSDYFFIAKVSNLLEDIRKMIYIIDLKDYPLIEWFLRSRIGKRRYEVLRSVRRTIDPDGLEHMMDWLKKRMKMVLFMRRPNLGPPTRDRKNFEVFLTDPRKFDPNQTISLEKAVEKYKLIRQALIQEGFDASEFITLGKEHE